MDRVGPCSIPAEGRYLPVALTKATPGIMTLDFLPLIFCSAFLPLQPLNLQSAKCQKVLTKNAAVLYDY